MVIIIIIIHIRASEEVSSFTYKLIQSGCPYQTISSYDYNLAITNRLTAIHNSLLFADPYSPDSNTLPVSLVRVSG